MCAKAAAPPTRGWTPSKSRRSIPMPGCPAYAGMDQRYRRATAELRRLPRLRGDGPQIWNRFFRHPTAAPPTRGWTRFRPDQNNDPDGCPAYAGMDPTKSHEYGKATRLPRLRGDGPADGFASEEERQAAPPTRGWTHQPISSCGRRMGCPAYAGMDPGRSPMPDCPQRLPRLRGDGPWTCRWRRCRCMAAPPTRGWTRRTSWRIGCGPGCPAYAGMDPKASGRPPKAKRLPRLRGDGPIDTANAHVLGTAAPPTRGWTLASCRHSFAPIGCPAYAGMDPYEVVYMICKKRLPRLRGDGPFLKWKTLPKTLAAPPTRGWTL